MLYEITLTPDIVEDLILWLFCCVYYSPSCIDIILCWSKSWSIKFYFSISFIRPSHWNNSIQIKCIIKCKCLIATEVLSINTNIKFNLFRLSPFRCLAFHVCTCPIASFNQRSNRKSFHSSFCISNSFAISRTKPASEITELLKFRIVVSWPFEICFN